MSHRFRPAARHELLEAVQWYLEEGGPSVAAKFELAVERAGELLPRCASRVNVFEPRVTP